MITAAGTPTASLGAQDPRWRPVALVNVNVVDVESGTVVPNRTVVVRDGRIEAVTAARAATIPRGATIFQGAGRFVIPGLWDMHVHQTLFAGLDSAADRRLVLREALAYFRALSLANGVTGVRDVAGDFAALREADSLARRTATPGPRMLFTGSKLGDGPVLPGAPFPIRSSSEVRRSIAMLKSAGAALVKLSPGLPAALRHEAQSACRAEGIPCVAHLPDDEAAAEAAKGGMRSFEHLFLFPENTSTFDWKLLAGWQQEMARPRLWQRVAYRLHLRERPRDAEASALDTHSAGRAATLFRELAANGAWVTPTLVLHDLLTTVSLRHTPARDTTRMIERPTGGLVREERTPENQAGSRRKAELYQLLVRELRDAGVGILAGTDAPLQCVPGHALHGELLLLQRAGLTPLEALRTATLEPARYLDATDTLGAIRVGRVADLVVLRANPLEDVGRVAQIEAVMTRGRLLLRSELDGLLSEGHRALTALRAGLALPAAK